VAQSKFVHTISAGYVTGAMFVLAISCYYLLKNSNTQIARKSIVVASAFGLLSALSVVVLGDESGYSTGLNQRMKLAAIEGMWETEEAPASLTIIGVPNQEKQANEYVVEVPYALGLIATRSFNKKIPGIKDLVEISEARIRSGISQYVILKNLRTGNSSNPQQDKIYLRDNFNDIGYALLLKKYRGDIENSSEEEIKKAASDTVPNVAPLFYGFRVMVALGLYFIILFSVAFYQMNIKRNFDRKYLLKLCLLSLPLPWIAAEFGWFIAEYGRQPWVIEGILPTFLGVSPVSAGNVLASLIGFIILYTSLLVVDLYLMIKYIKLGPNKLGS